MNLEGFDRANLEQMLRKEFAPWIQALNIEIAEPTDEAMIFVLPENANIVRHPDIICGQAVASFADTISVLTLFAHNKEERLLTTVDMNVQFMRALKLGPVFARTFVQSNGRRMANVRTEFSSQPDFKKLAASSVCVFAYL